MLQISQSTFGYYDYRRQDPPPTDGGGGGQNPSPPPPPPEVEALINLLHPLEQNYKLTDARIKKTEDEDEKAALEEVKEANKNIAEAMFKDQEISDITTAVLSLFGDFEGKYNEWEELVKKRRRRRRRLLYGKRRDGDDHIEEIKELQTKVEEMNEKLDSGDTRRLFRRVGRRRNGTKSRRSLMAYARNLQSDKVKKLRRSYRGMQKNKYNCRSVKNILGFFNKSFRKLLCLFILSKPAVTQSKSD